MPASGKTEETVSSVIGEALGKMGLSLAALLLLILFADYAEKYGWPQILALLALHIVGLLLLWNSASTGKVGPAIAALVLGVVWNAAAILYMIAESGPRLTINGVVETKPPTTEVGGTLLLTWWYISSIRKVSRFQ